VERAEVVEVLAEKAALLLEAPGLLEGDVVAGRGVDSLAVVEWALDVEEALGVELSGADLTAAPTLGELADVILSRRA
jgi:acyl carrier protein